ncbi:MAG: extracellular catalytic domain type 1 short-chain-length polyhydroxyalkanoate depolymerase [Planctomycetota bacterium]
MEVNGRKRSYELHVPEDLAANEPAPLLVALHRLFASGNDMAYMSGFNEIADRERFVVVYPNGPGGRWDTFGGEYRDDVQVVLATIEDVAAAYPIDRDRVYLTGASNGGFMTYILACTVPGTFAAAAPVKGLMQAVLAEDTSAGPLPILIIHGTRDGLVPYDATKILGTEMLTVDDAVAYWVKRNGCDPSPAVEELADRDPHDRTRVTVERYAGGQAPVMLCRVEGGGHTWPGGREPGLGLMTGRMSRDIEASEMIWRFFASQRGAAAGRMDMWP